MKVAKEVLHHEREAENLRQMLSIEWLTLIDDVKEKRRCRSFWTTTATRKDYNDRKCRTRINTEPYSSRTRH